MTAIAATAGHVSAGPGPLGWIAIIIAVIIGRVLLVLASPTGKCRGCNGQKVRPARFGGQAKVCPRCKGAGRRPRVGAALIHRHFWDTAGDAVAARFREQARQQREKAGKR